MNAFRERIETVGDEELYAVDIETIQVNLGYYCNQSCSHCHLECSPRRTEMMQWPTMELVISAARSAHVTLVDVTGGAPELNPDFTRFIASLSAERIPGPGANEPHRADRAGQRRIAGLSEGSRRRACRVPAVLYAGKCLRPAGRRRVRKEHRRDETTERRRIWFRPPAAAQSRL